MGQRLLVVDSDRSFLKEHQVSLEAAYDVDFLPAPDGAVQRLENGSFAAVLICVEVSENKGYALCSAIRKNPKLATVHVALISAKATEEEYRRHQSLKGRADLYLHKPLTPGALVGALSPLVPPRSVDPDNPLGDLSGDLGEEWLESLKDELEAPPAPPAPPAPAPAPLPATHQTVAMSMDMLRQIGIGSPAQTKSSTAPLPLVTPPPPEGATVAISMEQLRESLHAPPPATPLPPTVPDALPADPGLQLRVQELEAILAGKSEALVHAETEIERLSTELELSRQSEARATRNLDEMDRLAAELEGLRARLKEREEALQRTREDYDALQRRNDAITQDLDVMERRQKEAEELNQKLAKAEEALQRLEQASSKEGENAEALKGQLRQAISEHQDLLHQIEQLNFQMSEKSQRVIDLLKERDRLQHLALEAESHRERADALERTRGDLELERDGLRGRLEEAQPSLARLPEAERDLASTQAALAETETRHQELGRAHVGLEEAHRELQTHFDARVRDAEELSVRIHNLEKDLEGKEATLRAQGRDLAGLEGRLKAAEGESESLRGRLGDLESQRQAADQERENLQQQRASLEAHCVDLERQLGKLVGQHEAERMELMRGLDDKEAEVGRHLETLEATKKTVHELEEALRDHQSRLADRNERLAAMSALLGELGERIQRGSDLTKA